MVSPPYSPSSNQRRRFRLWKPYSFTSNVARFIVLISFCLTLTVVTTTIRYGKNNHQQFLLLRRNLRDSSSNSLFSHSRRELAGRHLRFLALGGPSTGGQGLSNALDAYPHQLANARNQNVDNYASSVVLGSASASQYSKEQQIMASLCTQSIVGDSNIYDIITLEYQDLDASALSLLTKRLRERFPRAIILFVKLWSPVDFYYIDVEGKEVSFAEWRIQQPSSLEWDDKSAMIRAMQEQRWHLREQLEIGVELEKIFGAVNGMIYQLPTPLNINDNLNVLVEWFEESNSKSSRSDSSITPIHYTLSSNAHTKVYTDLEKIVQKELKRSYEDSATGISPSNTPLVGTWGSGDRCNLWYETGKELSEQHYSRGLQHKEFSHHHALEVVASSGGTLQVQNPFDEDRVVYLTHRPRTSAVGTIPAGATVLLEFTPLEEYTMNKFRIVGLSFLAKEKASYRIPSDYAILFSQGLEVDDEEEEGTYTSYHSGPTFSLSGWWGKPRRVNNELKLDSTSSTSGDVSQR